MTPLAGKLAARIRAGGPMTLADYMATCLGDPEHGYYMTREPFGVAGDFITAPEVSQMFGELIGLWSLATWQAMGTPARFALTELGPGRGTLMADALRAARVRPDFVKAAEIHLVEASPRLRQRQKETLTPADMAVVWHDAVETLPAEPMILLANEFFDALPIRQFLRTAGGWAERMVGIGANGELAFGLRPGADPSFHPLDLEPPEGGEAEGSVLEFSSTGVTIAEAIADRLVRTGGAALIIDYGHQGPGFGDTLQAVRAHRHTDPLAEPGEADLTAHVDFAALSRAARRSGARAAPIIGQGEFLGRLGLRERVDALSRSKDEATRADIAAAAERLAGPQGMGTLFKVLGIAAPGLALPALDDNF